MAGTAEAETRTLNHLLRGETSAREVCRQALHRLDRSDHEEDVIFRRLDAIQGQHEEAAGSLRRQVLALGGTPTESAGARGTWVGLAEKGAARVFGKESSLKVLLKGEEHGFRRYESALRSGRLPSGFHHEIRDSILPRQFHHIQALRVMTDSL